MTKKSENPFWNFSLTVYARGGVAPACLRLQDRYGVDVNILLYCCWAARHRGLALDDASLGRVLASVAEWKEQVVAPLRVMRRALKDGFPGFDPVARETFRTKIKGIELDAERLQQDSMVGILTLETSEPPLPEELRDIMTANVHRYLRSLSVETDGAAKSDAGIVIEASLRELP